MREDVRERAGINRNLLESFLRAQAFARKPKIERWLKRPGKYALGLLWSYLLYPVFRKGLPMRCTLFTGDKIVVPLPAGLDLFLTGVKAHDSELRLVRYLLSVLQPAETVIDAGAHLGYYTMVMAACVSREGTVIAFEPSAKTGDYLRKNALHKIQIRTEPVMLSSGQGESTFHEFPLRYSEFNTAIHRVTEKKIPSKARVVTMTSLDEYCRQNELSPSFIKLDVEGGELNILKGAVSMLEDVRIIAIELRKNDYRVLYAPAVQLLQQSGFTAFRIDAEGRLSRVDNVEAYIMDLTDESDNVIFKKV